MIDALQSRIMETLASRGWSKTEDIAVLIGVQRNAVDEQLNTLMFEGLVLHGKAGSEQWRLAVPKSYPAQQESKSAKIEPAHAFLAGQVFGLAIKHGFTVEPVVDEDGIVTNRMEVLDSGFPENLRVFINVEPPVVVSETKEG